MSKIANLHFTKSNKTTYFRYRLPNGCYEPLGKDLKMAELAALSLNARLEIITTAKLYPEPDNSKTLIQLINHYQPAKIRSSKSRATIKEWKRKFKLYRQWMKDWKVDAVTVMDLDQLLEEKALTYDTYRLHRLLFAELFTYALGKGWRKQVEGNPGKALLPPKLARIKTKKVRKRMTLDIFNAIREQSPPWLQIALDLALHIGIRRGDICTLKLEDFREGHLFFIPSKTADMLIPVAIKIPLTADLQKMVSRARNLSPLSAYFLHRSNAFYRSCHSVERKHRTQVIPEQLTRFFQVARGKAMLERPELFKTFKKEELPTFHEVRSLCAKLYQNQGRNIAEIQILLGHADERMTKIYQAGYGIEWQEAKAGLQLP